MLSGVISGANAGYSTSGIVYKDMMTLPRDEMWI